MHPRLALFLATCLVGPAFAAPPATDQVAASFERMLSHTPTAALPAAPADTAQDPLRLAVCAMLWQQPSYHIALNAPTPKR